MNSKKKLITKTTESECANNNGNVCSSNSLINLLKTFMRKIFPNEDVDNKSKEEIIKILKKKLNCDSESCILVNDEIKNYIGDKISKLELDLYFKPYGPRNSTKLLNNYNIDETLAKWAREFKHFYPCPFAMIDFDYNGDKFGMIKLDELLDDNSYCFDPKFGRLKGPFYTFGCVINTDVSTGKGKHWMAIFTDLRKKEEWSIEFFNSSGNPPNDIIIAWEEKQRSYLLKHNPNTKTVISSNIVHQTDNHSCGPYSLYYIRARLDGVPYTYFQKNRIPDEEVVEFRKHLFRYH